MPVGSSYQGTWQARAYQGTWQAQITIVEISGASNASSSASATLSVNRSLAGSSNGVAHTVSFLSVTLVFAGTSDALSNVASAILVDVPAQLIVNIYKTASCIDAYSHSGSFEDAIFAFPPDAFDGDVGEVIDHQVWIKNDGYPALKSRPESDFFAQPIDKSGVDEADWIKLAATQAGLDAAIGGASIIIPDLDSGETYSFWIRATVPAGLTEEDKRDLRIKVQATIVATDYILTIDDEAGVTEEFGRSLNCPVLSVSPLELDYGANPTVIRKRLIIANAGSIGAGWLNWLISNEGSFPAWLNASKSSGSLGRGNSENIYMSIARGGVACGVHLFSVGFSSNGGDETVSVAWENPCPVMVLNPSSLDFGTMSNSKSFNTLNNGPQYCIDLVWACSNWGAKPSWITSGIPGGTLARGESSVTPVTIDRSGQSPGSYSFTMEMSTNDNDGNVGISMEVPFPNKDLRFYSDPACLIEISEIDISAGGTFIYMKNVGLGALTWTLINPKPSIFFPQKTTGGLAPGASTWNFYQWSFEEGTHSCSVAHDFDGDGTSIYVIMVYP